MAAEGDELNLEELIKCVSIGKTSIDSSSGKCNFPSNESETADDNSIMSESSDGDFNPLTLQVSISDISDPFDTNYQLFKKYKQNEQNNPDSFALTKNETITQTSNETDTVLNISSNDRLKRKRRLFDTDTHCLLKMNDKVVDKLEDSNVSNSSEVCTKNKLNNSYLENGVKQIDSPTKLIVQLEPCPEVFEEAINDRKVCEDTTLNLPNLEHLTLHEESSKLKHSQPSEINVSKPTEIDEQLSNSIENDASRSGLVSEINVTLAIEDDQSAKNQTKKRKSENSSESETRNLRKRIRKTLPPVKARQTPLGLPKPLRIKKDKFSLEEIYTNKNYSTPVPKQLETIFEYPKEDKDGTVRYSEKKRKQRAMYFCTDPADRPSKKKTKFKKRSTRRSKRDNDAESDTKLIQALSDLDRQLLLSNLSP